MLHMRKKEQQPHKYRDRSMTINNLQTLSPSIITATNGRIMYKFTEGKTNFSFIVQSLATTRYIHTSILYYIHTYMQKQPRI